MNSGELPAYRDLPVAPEYPPGSAWGVFGAGDNIGTLNLLTPERVTTGSAAVRDGKVFSLNWELDLPDPAVLGRGSAQHVLLPQDTGFDDRYDNFHPQASSQWDALRHVRHPEHGFYNGHRGEDTSGCHLGIDTWAHRGIAGRFLLADIAAHRSQQDRPIDCARGEEVTIDEVADVLLEQGVKPEPGDILLLRFGWTSWYESLSAAERQALVEELVFPAPGLRAEERTAQWLWDQRVAAVAADCPAVEAMPFDKQDPDGFLHYRLIALLGMALGELFRLDGLAADCADDGRYVGMFTAAPLNMPGGAGSTANALAIK